MKLFHRTHKAKEILSRGFRDGKGTYMTAHEWKGVWLSNIPLEASEGARGNTLLSIDIPEGVVTPYEWVEEGKPYREFLIPAKIVNSFGHPSIEIEE